MDAREGILHPKNDGNLNSRCVAPAPFPNHISDFADPSLVPVESHLIDTRLVKHSALQLKIRAEEACIALHDRHDHILDEFLCRP
jgi:hypothetical protein